MKLDPELIEPIRRALTDAHKILVVAHVSPDGDALGSLTAMGQALLQLGKRPTLACDDGGLSDLAFLPLARTIRRRLRGSDKFDLLISVDCGDLDRLGLAYMRLPEPKPPILNIDHHISNTRFGAINLVLPEATSTAEILALLFLALDITITKEIATSLLTGVVTDTLSFRVPSVTRKTLEVAGLLIEAGADLADITQRALVIKPLSTVQAWRIGLNNMRLEGRVAWTTLSQTEQRMISGDSVSHDGLSNLLSEIAEGGVGIVFSEREDGRVKVGFRSRPPFNVADVATELGGGGHRNAAGATIDGPLQQAARRVVDLMLASLTAQKESW